MCPASAAAAIGSVVGSIFFELFPRVMASGSDSAFDLTVSDSASPSYTLKVITVAAVIYFPSYSDGRAGASTCSGSESPGRRSRVGRSSSLEFGGLTLGMERPAPVAASTALGEWRPLHRGRRPTII